MPVSKLQELYEAFDDAATFSRETLNIRNQAGESVPLRLSPAQIKLDALIQSIQKKGKPVRIIALKARRVYVSTGVAQQFFHHVAFDKGQRGMIVAHQLRSCENVFSYYEQFEESYRPFRGVIDKLKGTIGRSKGNNRIDYAGGGSFRVLTANNVEGGRSDSIRYLHLSEYAFMKRARQLMAGLLQAVPMDPDTTDTPA